MCSKLRKRQQFPGSSVGSDRDSSRGVPVLTDTAWPRAAAPQFSLSCLRPVPPGAARWPRPAGLATMASSRSVLPRRSESTGSILCITSHYRAHLEFYSAPAGGRAALSDLSLSLWRLSILLSSLSCAPVGLRLSASPPLSSSPAAGPALTLFT